MKRLPVFAAALLATALTVLPAQSQAFFGFFGGGFSFGVGTGWWGGPGWWGPRSWHRYWHYRRPWGWYGRRLSPYWAAPSLWGSPWIPLAVAPVPATPAEPAAPEAATAK